MPKKNTAPTVCGGWHALDLPGHSANTWAPLPISMIQVFWYPFSPCLPLYNKGLQACWQELLLFVVTEVSSRHPSAAPTALGTRGALDCKKELVVLYAFQRCLGPYISMPEEISMLWRDWKIIVFSTACAVELGWIMPITTLFCLHSPKVNWDLGLQLGLLRLRETIEKHIIKL